MRRLDKETPPQNIVDPPGLTMDQRFGRAKFLDFSPDYHLAPLALFRSIYRL